MKRLLAFALCAVVLCVTGCGNTTQSVKDYRDDTANVETSSAENEANVEDDVTEIMDMASDETPDYSELEEAVDGLSAIGDIDVDKNLFDVTITMPAELATDMTQEKIDENVKDKGWKSGVLNDDGSVTYVMSNQKHKEFLDKTRTEYKKQLANLIGPDYPNLVDIETNDNFTNFKIITKSEKLDFAESFLPFVLYSMSGMYKIFSGEDVDNVHVDCVNADSGEIIQSTDSKDMENQ